MQTKDTQSSEAVMTSVFNNPQWFIVLTSFVNKCGDIGIRVFPMLLVERAISTQDSTLIMAFVKGTAILATFAGGYLGDKFGHKFAVITSFACAACGMFALPLAHSAFFICLAGMISTFGHGLFLAPLRIMLVQSVPIDGRQEALAWLRTGNNCAVMVANIFAYMTSGIGLGALFLFDAISSTAASLLGIRILPNTSVRPSNHVTTALPLRMDRSRSLCLLVVSLIISLFSLEIELFFVSTAAQARMSFGARGVEVYSQVYILNTIICTLFAVYSSRWIKSLRFAFVFGLLMQTCALSFFFFKRADMSGYFISVLFQTLGEVCFTAMAQYVLLQIIPEGRREGRVYSLALVVQLIGKTIGGAIAFYFLEAGTYFLVVLWTVNILFALLAMGLPQMLKRAKIQL